MDLFVGSAFPAPQITQRLSNQLGHIEKAARRATRKATAWLANRRIWSARIPVRVDTSRTSLPAELSAAQREILLSTGLNIAIGVSRSPGVARLASRCTGTTRIRVVESGQERAFLAPMPLRRLPGLSPSAAALLQASGLATIGELQRVPKAALQAELGTKEGLQIWRLARGLDRADAIGIAVHEPGMPVLANPLTRAPLPTPLAQQTTIPGTMLRASHAPLHTRNNEPTWYS
jgi:nucleotidyltransferase/DNA polymerase involved in DNA repair